MHKPKILIVEDDEITSLHLNMSLQKQGYTVVAVCHNAMQAQNKIATHNPDLIIVDISLDDTDDGIKLGQHIKDKYAIPFIYLTSYNDDAMIFQAKLTEPYGYIVKPFDAASLHATMQIALFKFDKEHNAQEELQSFPTNTLNLDKMLRDKQLADKPIVPFSQEYYFNTAINETFYRGEKITLTKKENAFLRLLIAKLGIVVSFEQARVYVWNESDATHNSVRTLVWRLRNKLKTDIIKNASGIGYYIEG